MINTPLTFLTLNILQKIWWSDVKQAFKQTKQGNINWNVRSSKWHQLFNQSETEAVWAFTLSWLMHPWHLWTWRDCQKCDGQTWNKHSNNQSKEILTEMWKAVNDICCPIKVQPKSNQVKGLATRNCTQWLHFTNSAQGVNLKKLGCFYK